MLPLLPWAFSLLHASAVAAPIALCTDLGPLVGEEDESGVAARLGPWIASGTREALVVQTPDRDVLFRGALGDLNPIPPPVLTLPEAVTTRLTTVGLLPGCPAGALGAWRVGEWAPLPRAAADPWAVYVGPSEVLARSEQGVLWLAQLGMRKEPAADLARGLIDALPDHEVRVAAHRGKALVLVSRGISLEGFPQGVPPAAEASRDWAAQLDLPEALIRGDSAPARSVHLAGAGDEIVATLDARRTAVGLPPLEVDPALTTAALDHCAYLDWARVELPFEMGHYQTPSSPVFTGKMTEDRAPGAVEVIGEGPGERPDRVVDRWLRQPFSREVLVSPGTTGVGACATPRGARVVLLRTTRPDAPWSWPRDGAVEVPLVFDGVDVPEPVIPTEHPERTLPFGMPVSVWLPDARDRVTDATGTLVAPDGTEVPVYLATPASHEDLASRTHGEIHLVPKDPLAADTEYTWTVRWKRWAETVPDKKRKREAMVPPEDKEWSGRFHTRSTAWEGPVVLPEAVTATLDRINGRRASAGAPPLVAHPALTTGSWLYIQGGEAALRRVVPDANVGVVCGNIEDVGTAPYERRLRPFEDPRFTGFGAAFGWDQACLAASGDLFHPPAWVPPKAPSGE